MGDSEYYVIVDLEGLRVGCICVLKDYMGELVWNELFCIYCCYIVFDFIIFIKDVVVIGIVVVGWVKFFVEILFLG